MHTTRDDSHAPARILIAAHHKRVRQLLRQILESAGYRVTEAPTAWDALWSVEMGATSVAFCDMDVPNTKGLWLADQITASSPATAIVLATSNSEIATVESMRTGIVAYLVKPLSERLVRAAATDGVRWSADARTGGALGRRRGP